jgi:hypothetical protein
MAFKLTERHKRYIDHRVRGVSRQQSAVLAGFGEAENSGTQVEEIPEVQAEIARVRAQMAVTGEITKDDVIRGLKDAAEMAKLIGDPQAMVRAWAELGKLCGFYAPEVKRIEKGINKGELRKALEDLSDDELYQISHGRVIDGKFERVKEDVPALPPAET